MNAHALPPYSENPLAATAVAPDVPSGRNFNIRLRVPPQFMAVLVITSDQIECDIWRQEYDRNAFTGLMDVLGKEKAKHFLEEVYVLEESGLIREAVDRAVNHIDDLLNGGRFGECSEIFSQADASKMSAELIISFLGITLAAKGKIPSRAGFAAAAKSKLLTDLGPDRTARLVGRYV